MENVKFYENQWVISVDLKMVNLLLGQKCLHTKFPHFSAFQTVNTNSTTG